MEKQRLRAQYNIREKQMRNYVKMAMHRPANPVDAQVQLLETSLDTIVYRAGLARTIYEARQFISHGHILVNGKQVNIPSHRLSANDPAAVEEKSRRLAPFAQAAAEMPALPGGPVPRTVQGTDVGNACPCSKSLRSAFAL